MENACNAADRLLSCRSIMLYQPAAKKEHEGIKERVIYVKNKRGTCSNCLRDNLCLNSGICSTCLKATRGTHKGTPKYAARLKAVRERLRPGMFKAA